ncbi:MAG: TolC family protein [Melioribacteraceae bacterium]|nr:TolC family protein [Melioribacteraceae bacterium]
MEKHISKLLIILALVGSSYSQTKLTLSDAISLGLENNYGLKISSKRVDISDENNTWGAAGRFPTIDLGVASVNRFDHNEEADITTNNLAPTAQLNWVLFNGFRIFNTKSKLEDQFKLAENNNAVEIENTIQDIILAYFNVLLQKERLNVFEELEKLSSDRYLREEASREIGGSVTYQVLQAKTAWLEDRAGALSQKLNYDNSIRTLNLLIGEKNDNKYDELDEFKTELNSYSFEDLYEKMLSSNKNLKNQYLNEIIAERDIDIARGGIYPRLSVTAGYDYLNSTRKITGLPSTKSDSYDYYGNVNLSMNIFDGFNTRRSLEIAKIQSEISKIQTEEITHVLTNTLTQLLNLYNIQKELIAVEEENLAATKLNLQISEEKYKSGAINSFNYRDIQIVYLNASLQRLSSIFNLINTNTELARLTGSIISEN